MKFAMTKSLLLASSILFVPAVAYAQPADQQMAEPPADAPSPDDPSLQQVSASEAQASEGDAKMALLQAQIEALQTQLDEVKKVQAKNAPVWKGAPAFSDPDTGWSFKPKGVLQFDAGYVSLPGGVRGTVSVPGAAGTIGASNLNTNNLGWGMRARRLIFGVEGSAPAGFGYKFELELSNGGVQYEDLILTWQKANSPLLATIGYHYPLQSLEQLTSNRFTSFVERAGMTDAFGYGRRLGLSLAYNSTKAPFSLAAGIWGRDIATPAVSNITTNGNQFGDNSWQASTRIVYAPWIGPMQAHFGVNFQYRTNSSDTQSSRYRMRPYTQITDQRFVDTGRIAAKGDEILGGELAGVWKSFHFAGEYQYVWVRGLNDTTINLGGNNAVNVGGAPNAAARFAQKDPHFNSWYAEVGYFLTGETRGYKGFKWDRTKVLHPIDQGGMGAWQINGRIDRTDLSDVVGSGPITQASAYANSSNYINGGKQTGYEASLIWLPTDYVKFVAQYSRTHVQGGPLAVSALTDPTLTTNLEQTFNVDTMVVRAQLDF